MQRIIKILILFFCLLNLSSCLFNHKENNEFDSTKWLTNTESRYKMAGGLIGSEILLKKDSSEVKDILVEPSHRIQATNRWDYSMGTGQSGLGLIIHVLSIRFESDRVIGVDHIEIKD